MNTEPNRETNNLLRALGFSIAFIIAWITGFLPMVASVIAESLFPSPPAAVARSTPSPMPVAVPPAKPGDWMWQKDGRPLDRRAGN